MRPQIAECPEFPARMVKHAVQDQAHTPAAQVSAQRRQVFPRTQAAVHLVIIRGVVAVAARFENRPKEEGIRAQGLDMIQPAVYPAQARLGRAGKIIALWRAASPQRENVIKKIAAVNFAHVNSIVIPFGIVDKVKKYAVKFSSREYAVHILVARLINQFVIQFASARQRVTRVGVNHAKQGGCVPHRSAAHIAVVGFRQ